MGILDESLDALENGESITDNLAKSAKEGLSKLSNKKKRVDPKNTDQRKEKLKEGIVLFVIKDGEISRKDPEDWKEYYEFYRIKSDVDKIAIIDMDKTKVRPILKDILNRQSQFLEFIYLKRLTILAVITLILTFKAAFHSDSGAIKDSQTALQNSMSGIISEMRKENEAQKRAFDELPINAFQPVGTQTVQEPGK